MNPSQLRHKRFTILGAARSGLAAARLLRQKDGRVFVSECQPAEQKRQAREQLRALNVRCEFGAHSEKVFDCDYLVLSPGIPTDCGPIREARRRNIPVLGELELASRFCPGPVVAITGTNGKSTTTALVGEMFRQAGAPAIVCGNIGFPFSDAVLEMDASTTAVVEVSGFQLETVTTFSPHVAILLNLEPDHLNRHGSFDAYVSTKLRLFEHQKDKDFAVYNEEDETTRRAMQSVCARSVRVPLHCEHPLECGGYVSVGEIRFRFSSRLTRLLPVEEIALRGRHNLLNALAASSAAMLAGLPVSAVRQALRRFRGLEHRLELVCTLNGVHYVNDSKATNLDAMRQALNSFDSPIILLAGGQDKGEDLSGVSDLISQKTRHCILLGETAEMFSHLLPNGTQHTRADGLEQAVHLARQWARTGDVVLLSPGCASFDMFQDFEERGRQFKEMVKSLRIAERQV